MLTCLKPKAGIAELQVEFHADGAGAAENVDHGAADRAAGTHCQRTFVAHRLVAFNAIPHLDTPERRSAITFA